MTERIPTPESEDDEDRLPQPSDEESGEQEKKIIYR